LAHPTDLRGSRPDKKKIISLKRLTKSLPLSVVSPAYKNAPQLAGFLASLRGSCRATRYEVVVVDDGSPNPDIAKVCKNQPKVRYLKLARNRGAAAARNAGARAARGRLVLFVDSDARVISNIVRWAVRSLKNPAYGAVIGGPDPRPLNPGFFTDFWALLKAECLPTGREAGSFYPAIGAIRRDLFLRLGGFHEKFQGASVEDFEFSERLKEAGIRTCYEPRMVVQFCYPGMLRNLRQSFSRAGKWMILRWRKVSFDRHTTTRRQAAGMLLGAVILPLLLAAVFGWIVWAWVGLAALAYLVAIGPFLEFCRRYKSWFYIPTAIALHVLVANAVVAGLVRAAFWRMTQVRSLEEFLSARDA